MNRLAIASIALSTLFFAACKKKEVADVTVTYTVSLNNPGREFYVRYVNETGGEDQEVISQGSWSKTYVIKSDTEKVPFEIWGSCPSKSVAGSPGQYQPQTVVLTIKEDDEVKATKSISGTSSIYVYSSDDLVKAELPSAVKYTSKK